MKFLINLTFLLVVIFGPNLSFSGEVTGAGARKLLVKHEFNVQALVNTGHKILTGELTGAGKRMNLDRVKLIITKKKVFEMKKADHIQFKHPSAAKSLVDVGHIEFSTNLILENQIEALVVK